MKNNRLTLSFLLFSAIISTSCSNKSTTEDSDLETNGDVVKSYSSKNYKLIALQARIRYGNKMYRWQKGTRPNWIGNRYEHYVALDLKDIFDSTANFQLIDHGKNIEDVQSMKMLSSTEQYNTFDFVKMDATNKVKHLFFKGLYSVKKDGEFTNKSASKYLFPLILPTKYRLRFAQDTLDIIYDNSKSPLGSEELAFRLKLSN